MQLQPVEKVVSELDALLVFEDNESKTFLLLGVSVLGNGDPFQGASIQEQFVQDLGIGKESVPQRNIILSHLLCDRIIVVQGKVCNKGDIEQISPLL